MISYSSAIFWLNVVQLPGCALYFVLRAFMKPVEAGAWTMSYYQLAIMFLLFGYVAASVREARRCVREARRCVREGAR